MQKDDLTNTLTDVKQFFSGTLEVLNIMLTQQEKALQQQKENIDALLKAATELDRQSVNVRENSKKDELSPEEIKKLKDMINV